MQLMDQAGYEPAADLARLLTGATSKIRGADGQPLNRTGLARTFGWNRASVSQWLNGKRIPPDSVIETIAVQAALPPGRRLELFDLADRARAQRSRERQRARSLVPLTVPPVDMPLIGRDPQFEQLKAHLQPIRTPPQDRRVAVLLAPPGYGKTRLAAEYFSWHIAQGVPGAQSSAWIGGSSPDTLAEGLADFARAHDVAEPSEPPARAIPKLARYLANRPNWLVVVDDARSAPAIDALLPRGPGSVLLTTTDERWRSLYPVIDLAPLSNRHAVQLLRHAAGRDDDAFGSLATELWCVPVFLAQLGRLLATSTAAGLLTTELVMHLQSSKADTLQHGLPSGAYPPLGLAVYHSFFAQLSGEAQSLLGILAYMNPTNIPLSLLYSRRAATTNDFFGLPRGLNAALATLSELAQYGLTAGGPRSVSCHQVVQDLFRGFRMPDEERTRARAVLRLLHETVDDAFVLRRQREASILAPHLERAVELLLGQNVDAEQVADVYRLAQAARRFWPAQQDIARAETITALICSRLAETSPNRIFLIAEIGRLLADSPYGSDRERSLDHLSEAVHAGTRCAGDPETCYKANLAALNAYGQTAHRMAQSRRDYLVAKRAFWRAYRLVREYPSQFDDPSARSAVRLRESWIHAQLLSNIAVVQTDLGQYRRAGVLLMASVHLDEALDGDDLQPRGERLAFRYHNLAYNALKWLCANRSTFTRRPQLLVEGRNHLALAIGLRRIAFGPSRWRNLAYLGSFRLAAEFEQECGRFNSAELLLKRCARRLVELGDAPGAQLELARVNRAMEATATRSDEY